MYDDFKQEYEKLKLALTQEEFEKAEMVLLMILQKNPNLPEAKLHLEKVRGKLGSISNYEFRVKAFLDQKDYHNAEIIIKEASEKFEQNAKIMALIEYYNKRVEKIAQQLTQSEKKDTPKDEDNLMFEDLPGLETLEIPIDSVKQNDDESPWAKTNGQSPAAKFEPIKKENQEFNKISTDAPIDEQVDVGHKPSPGIAPADKIGKLESPRETIKKLREESRRELPTMRSEEMAEDRDVREETGISDDFMKKQALLAYKTSFVGRRKTKESILDNPVFGSGLIVLVGAIVILPLIAAFIYIYQAATANVDVPVQSTPKWDAVELQTEKYSIYKEKFERLAQGNLFGYELDLFVDKITQLKDVPVKVLETYCSIFKIYEKRLSTEQTEKVDSWRNVSRIHLGLKTPISTDQLNSMVWKPDDMQFDVPTLESNSFKISFFGVLFGILPGLILGLALARGRIPFINRIFDAFWEYWFATPSIAILFIGTWVFKDSYINSESAYGFVSLLMGLMIAPHIAFYIQQGFENIRKKTLITEFILSVLIILSAVAIGVARLLGEAVLTLGLISTVEGNAHFAQSIHSFAAPIFQSLCNILPGSFLIFGEDFIPESGVFYNQSVSMILTYKIFLFSFVLSLIGQGMQILVAYMGLKSDVAAEKTSLHQFRMFSKSNLIFVFLGLALVIIMIVVFANGQGEIDPLKTEKWSQEVNKESIGQAVSDTFIISAFTGVIALFIGLIPVLLVSLLIRDRLHKASIEALLRIPLGISPLVVVVIAIEILNRMNAVPNQTNMIFITSLIVAPVAWSVLFRTFDRFNGAPYVKPNEVSTPSKKLFVFLARVLSFVSVSFFLMALSMGILEIFIGFKSGNSLVYQLFLMIRDNYQNPATVIIFKTYMSLMLKFIGASLLFKIL
ncbi:MAG: hypothetical protein K8S87_12265, partial [Planctomycetes bacterium]|nr:hypothetical protein [Planctomycetota bacterium]